MKLRNDTNRRRAPRAGGRIALGIWFAACALSSSALHAQVPGASALTGVDDQNLPSGARLTTTYRPGQGRLQVQGARGVGAAAALGTLQVQMPAGITLGRASTTRVMGRMPIVEGVAKGRVEDKGAADSQAKYFTLYPLAYRGVPLAKGSDYLAVVSADDGQVLQTRERGVPTSVDAAIPTITADAAAAAARAEAGAEFFPSSEAPHLEVWVDEQQKGHLSWAIKLDNRSETQPRARIYWVAATGAARSLHWESTIFHTHFGIVSGELWESSPFKPMVNRSLQDMTISRSDGTSVVSGIDGRYGFPAGVGLATLSATLQGPFFQVSNKAGANLARSVSSTPAVSANLNFGSNGDLELSQSSAFYWANIARRVAGILAPPELASLPINVNIASTCNAYWDGSSINFFQAGGGCPNTAYSDVVMHEYGHGIDAVKGGILDGGYSEGFGDALAILGTRQSCLGRDFLGAGTCLRPATDLVMWPPAAGEGVHAIGRRYAGFTWELVQQLKRTYSDEDAFSLATRLVMAAASANPSDIPDAVRLSFIADDTDGNLATCSPHFNELAAAADSRHIPRPANCEMPADGNQARAGAAQFPWTPPIAISANSNLATVTLTLPTAMQVHIVANTSAHATGKGAVQFSTGFYNQSAVNVMWTDSLRAVTAMAGRHWSNFGSTFSITLPAGTHRFYWKLWTSANLELSAGSILVEAFPMDTSMTGVAAAATVSISTVDARGRITLQR